MCKKDYAAPSYDPIDSSEPHMAACAAARAGALSARIGVLPFLKLKLDFTGTGVAEIRDDQLSSLAAGTGPNDTVPLSWIRNVFVGEHWLLGRFRIDLDRDRPSHGTVSKFRSEGQTTTALNRNEFNFVFQFQRIPRLKFTTKEPIVNEAEIQSIPPMGSVYSIPAENTRVMFGRKTTGEPNITNLDFDYCSVTVFPERNVDVEIIDISISELIAKVRIRITNQTNSTIRSTFFIVDHEMGISVKDDGVFFSISPQSSVDQSFEVHAISRGNSYSLPLFTGIYKPDELRGSKSTTLSISF